MITALLLRSRIVLIVALLMLLVCVALYPPVTKSGNWATITIAFSNQDYPSGIYYERQFDWPTGEAAWVDVPAFWIYLALGSFLPLIVAIRLRQARAGCIGL